MDKKYTVKEFVDEFLNDKIDFKELALQIKNEYVPFSEKTARAQMIVDSTYYVVDNGNKIFHMNSSANYMLTCLNLVDMYSPIKINYNDSLSDFDFLSKSGLMYWIMDNISKRELTEFTKINEMVGNDEITNNHEIHNFIDRQTKRFKELLEILINPIIDNIDTDNIKGLLNSAIDSINKANNE